MSPNSEQEILREEINSLQAVKTKLQGRIKDLEEDLKKTRDDLEKKNQAAQEQENEVGISSFVMLAAYLQFVYSKL